MNFNSISPSVPEIKGLDRQTDGQQSDLITVPFSLTITYGILKKVNFIIFFNLTFPKFEHKAKLIGMKNKP